jgi:hypothetical protein
VIADLRNEVAHQDFNRAGLNGAAHPVPESGVLHNEDGLRLAQRIDQVERSVNRILPIVRKILFTVSERGPAANEGALPDEQDVAR